MELRILTLAAAAFLAATSFAQGGKALTLDEALRMARSNNGTVRAAVLNYESAKATTRASKAAFLPTITPSAQQDYGRIDQRTGAGPFAASRNVDDLTTQIDVAWTLLDSGNRRFALRQAELNRDAVELSSLTTLRQTLFSVHSRFYEALRRQELLRVQDRQVERARVILDQTKFRASDEIGDAPRKDIKQAEADFLNAQVSQLAAQNRISTAFADLRAVIGAERSGFAAMEAPQMPEFAPLAFTLDQAISNGMSKRADLMAERKRVEVEKVQLKNINLEGSLRWSVDATYRRTFNQDVSDRSLLSFNISYPLFDGFRSRERSTAQRLSIDSAQEALKQSELDASAEIEGAYKEYTQNLVRLVAAQRALEAAQENFTAAVEAQKAGAGSLLEVLAAQVTLTTSESNLVEARYDTVLSDVRLRLALGETMPGEVQ